ncbi:tether containing UBX domain for GLUT4 [Musca autumnalis]|uniref:tether containing UBX domain for GLUT4 n=1 Tax=Musca autumnalis TaxID=221902 RepID=UPI003CEBDB10
MESKVTVLTPNGRRQNVRISPNMTLLQILEDVCTKHNLSSDDFTLKHHNKEVSMAQTFRFSGLPNNCLLEMSEADKKRTVANVDICVQLEDGTRKQAQFKSTTNLWTVVEELAGVDELKKYESPVIMYMRQDIMGKDKLEKTALKSLGILEGRALLRLANKKVEELKTQAMVYAPPPAKVEAKKDENDNVKPKSTKSAGGGGGGFAITKDLVKSLKKAAEPKPEANDDVEEANTDGTKTEDTPKEVPKPKYDWGDAPGRSMQASKNTETQETEESMEPDVEPEYYIIGDHNAVLYNLDAAQSQIEDLPDSFYDLTVNDLKLVLRDLRKIATGDTDAPLLTEKLREIENNNTMLRKISQYKNCAIRIQFPDRHVLQGMFKPIDKISDVLEFAKRFLIKPEQPCYLYTIPPKTILDLDKTLLELDFVPNALVHFSTEDENNETVLIKEEYLKQLTSPEGALYAANKLRKQNQNIKIEEVATTTCERPQISPSTGAIPKRPRNNEVMEMD